MPDWSPILFIGGAHIDLIGRLDSPPLMAVSNPGRVFARPGGAALNMATCAAALGFSCAIASPVGADEYGAWLHRILAERGIGDHLSLCKGESTGTYSTIIEPDGQMVIGLADLAIYETDGWLSTQRDKCFEAAAVWCLTANLKRAKLRELASDATNCRLVAVTISPSKAPRLRPILHRLDCLFTNHGEAVSLLNLNSATGLELVQEFIGAGVPRGTLSQGAGPLLAWEEGQIHQVVPPKLGSIVDVNGAGDTLASTVLVGLARGLSMDICARYGTAAAQWTLGQFEPYPKGLDWESLNDRAAMIEPAQRLR